MRENKFYAVSLALSDSRNLEISGYYEYIMSRKRTTPKSDFDIPEYQFESLARVLLPIFQEYLSSEQGQKDYVEWQQLQLNKKLKNKESR